jgi:hypothetical protein
MMLHHNLPRGSLRLFGLQTTLGGTGPRCNRAARYYLPLRGSRDQVAVRGLTSTYRPEHVRRNIALALLPQLETGTEVALDGLDPP